MNYDFSKFIKAQEFNYSTALKEITTGQKSSHWIWYIFPQLKALGQSPNAQYYGIENLEEARAYLSNKILGARLVEISQAILDLQNNDIEFIMGSKIDAVKLRSCMTLFILADPNCEVFQKVLDKYFGGNRDEKTVSLCAKIA